jgi:hypothetical protein
MCNSEHNWLKQGAVCSRGQSELIDNISSGSWLVDVFSLLSNETEIELPELATRATP